SAPIRSRASAASARGDLTGLRFAHRGVGGPEIAHRAVVRFTWLFACVVLATSAAAANTVRIQGVVTQLHSQEVVLLADGHAVVVAAPAVGGIRAAFEVGQSAAVIGTMDPGGGTPHAARVESLAAKPATTTRDNR